MSLARTMPLLLVILFADSPFVHSQAQSTDNPESVHFRAGYFATPLVLQGDPLERAISSIEISCKSLLPQGGKAIFCVEQGVVEFNAFGDATIKESRKRNYQVTFARLAEEDIADGRQRQDHNRRLYEIIFDDGVWNVSFLLNLSNDGTAVPRLVQYDPNPRVCLRAATPITRLFPLTNLGFKKDSALDEDIGNDLSLRTVYVELQPGQPTSRIRILGTLGGDGTFSHDSNHITYSDYGDLGLQTLRGFQSPKMKLVEQRLEDPREQGRRLLAVQGIINFRLAANAPLPEPETQLFVVVSPRAAGQHRLIIQQNGKITHVLPLVDDLWQQFAKETAALNNQRSVAAVLRLRTLFRNGLRFHVNSGEVANLTYSGEVTDVALNELENLPRLAGLTFAGCTKLTEQGFAAFKEANSINILSFWSTPVSDAVLLHACQLPNLQHLTIKDNRTAADTDAGIQITDDGLKELSKLTELQSLTLCGSKITDHGLASLKNLDRLNYLRLAHTSVTPAGFIELGGSMSCNSMDLYYYRSENESYEITYLDTGQKLSVNGVIDPEAYKKIPRLMKLQQLRLPDSATENDLKEISASSTLRSLSLAGNSNMTADNLKHLTTLSSLEDLNLRGCLNLQDEAISSLKQLTSQRKLDLSRTKISQSAMDQLEVVLPECQLIRR